MHVVEVNLYREVKMIISVPWFIPCYASVYSTLCNSIPNCCFRDFHP